MHVVDRGRTLYEHDTLFFFLMILRPPRSTQSRSSAASDVYKRQEWRNVKAEIKQEVLRMIDQGMDYKDIASELGISKGRISQIKAEGKK